jgi:hypothetical protein
MKVMIGLLVVIATLGVWGGFHAWYSPTVWLKIQGAAAFLMGVNLLFMTWLWSRASFSSGEAPQFSYFPFILLSVAMLVNVLPGLFWPAQESLRIGASGLSIVLSAIAVILILRWNRRVWAARTRRT